MKKKITITDELKAANVGKLDDYEVGQEVKLDDDSSLSKCAETDPPCAGHWVRIGGVCVCNPAP